MRVCACIAALLLATVVRAQPSLPKWHISAGRLQIPAGGLATDFTVTNDDRVDERFEITGYSWQQSSGVDLERPDLDDVVVVPRLFGLGPGESERVRVGVPESDASIESDYRVRVAQLFDPRPDRSGIHFLLAFSLPLFTTPDRGVVDARVVSIASSKDSKKLLMTLRNDGNVHAYTRSITVRWRGTATTFGRPFYVLPRQTAIFVLPMRRCGEGDASVVPDADSKIAPLRASLSIPCR